jgi:hypothetical protein
MGPVFSCLRFYRDVYFSKRGAISSAVAREDGVKIFPPLHFCLRQPFERVIIGHQQPWEIELEDMRCSLQAKTSENRSRAGSPAFTVTRRLCWRSYDFCNLFCNAIAVKGVLADEFGRSPDVLPSEEPGRGGIGRNSRLPCIPLPVPIRLSNSNTDTHTNPTAVQVSIRHAVRFGSKPRGAARE